MRLKMIGVQSDTTYVANVETHRLVANQAVLCREKHTFTVGSDGRIEQVTPFMAGAEDLLMNYYRVVELRDVTRDRQILLPMSATREPSLKCLLALAHLEAALQMMREMSVQIAERGLPIAKQWFRDLAAVEHLLGSLQDGETEAKDEWGRTLLYICTDYGFDRVATALLELGANPDARGPDGETALMLVSAQGNDYAVTSLIRHGADIAIARDSDGATAWHMLCEKGDHQESHIRTLLSLFLENGQDPMAHDAKGMTLSERAAEAGNDALSHCISDMTQG